MAFRLLGRSPQHSLNFIRSLVLPILVMVSVLGLVNGLSGEVQAISSQIRSTNTAIICSQDASGLHESRLNGSIVEIIQRFTYVKQVLPQKLAIATIFNPKTSRDVQIEVYGVDLDQFMNFHTKAYIREGLFISGNEPYEGLMGAWIADKLALEENYPFNITIRAEVTLNAHVTGKLEDAGRYAAAMIISPTFFDYLFPSLASHFTFVEIEFGLGVDVEKSANAIQSDLLKAGYSCKVVGEQGQGRISRQILNDVLSIFWTFSIAVFFVIALQIHFTTKWIGLHYREEFRLLRVLGMSRLGIVIMLLSMALFLGNLALGIAILIGLPLGTASLAILTLFSGTTRFYAAIQLSDIVIFFIFSNIAIFLGSFHQAWNIGTEKNLITGIQG